MKLVEWAMQKTTPIFPGFNVQTLRRKPRSAQQKLADKMTLLNQKSFKQAGEVFGRFIPASCLIPELSGSLSRRRIFTKENTFWAFFSADRRAAQRSSREQKIARASFAAETDGYVQAGRYLFGRKGVLQLP
jgi:hypothetical protein